MDGCQIFVYVSSLRISRLLLAETICGWYCILGQISIYNGGAAEIFKDLEMIMAIYQFKKDVYVNCENKKSRTVTEMVMKRK